MTRAAALVLSLVLASAARAGEPPTPRRELVVMAAASLRDAFTSLARSFEGKHPGATVTLDFAGSQQLRTQVEHGAAADVFASADAAPLQALVGEGLCRPGVVFARNALVLIIPEKNPAGLDAFSELRKARHIVVGVPESPIGAYTVKLLERADRKQPGFKSGVESRIASRELNVRQVLAKVALGEADAGFVYRTDALSARGRVKVLEVPADLGELAEYQVAALTRAREPALAQEFIAVLTGAEGRRALAEQGFLVEPAAGAPSPEPSKP